MLDVYRKICTQLNETEIGNIHLVLIEGTAKKTGQILGRNEFYIKVVFDQCEIPSPDGFRGVKPGDYVAVRILSAKASVLSGTALYHTSISEFYGNFGWADRNSDEARKFLERLR